MTDIFDFLFSQYEGYTTTFLILEIIASIFGALSVVYSARNSILVYPTGLVSTALYVYLLYEGSLYGDMIINAYYFTMSIYGWMLWSRKDKTDNSTLKISKMTSKDNTVCIQIFLGSVIFVSAVYLYFDKFTYWWAYVDTFITGLFFIGMWLLAKRKLENWIFLIIGDIIAIPLFFLKGYKFTSMLSLFLTIVAFIGYFSWKKTLQNKTTAP